VPVIVPDRGGAADHARGGAGIAYKAGNALSASQAIVDMVTGQMPVTANVPQPVTMEDHFARLFADYASIARAPRRAA